MIIGHHSTKIYRDVVEQAFNCSPNILQGAAFIDGSKTIDPKRSL